MEPQILSSIISSAGTIAAAVIAAVTAKIIGRKFLDRERLKNDLETAVKDIEFLLSVEEIHCGNNREMDGHSSKNKVRDMVRDSGIEWSGRFTPGRVKNP